MSSVFNEYADIYDTEIIALRKKLGYDNARPDNFLQIMDECKIRALKKVSDYLRKKEKAVVKDISIQFPYSVYDYEVIKDGIKKYVIVRFTATNKCYFNIPSNCIRFISTFQHHVEVFLVCDVIGKPCIHRYSANDLFAMKKTIESVTYEDLEGEHE